MGHRSRTGNGGRRLRLQVLPVVEPYALRHSSIVRQLREGLPTRLVASLHDTSVTMIARNYAFYIADALDEIARRAIVPLAPAPVAALKAVG
jgi:hypothetical protein